MDECREHCPMCGRDLSYERNGNTYSKAYLVEVRGVYDGGLFYRDVEGCGMAWHRWGTHTAYDTRLHNLADEYVAKVNAKIRADAEDGFPYRYGVPLT
jgi:hypothetical protein